MANRYEDKVASVSKALTILEELSREPEGLGLLEISGRVDMHKTTVYRMLTSLMEKNYVEQDEQTGKYSMGLKILTLANAFYEKVDVRIIIRKYISELLEQLEGFILVSKQADQEYAVMDCVEHGLMVPVRVGEIVAKESIITKTFCANSSSWQQGRQSGWGLPTKKDIEIRQELKNISVQGYGFSEKDIGALPCIAAPVFDYSKNIVCVISLHTAGIEEQKILSQKILKLLEAANRVSGELGFAGYL